MSGVATVFLDTNILVYARDRSEPVKGLRNRLLPGTEIRSESDQTRGHDRELLIPMQPMLLTGRKFSRGCGRICWSGDRGTVISSADINRAGSKRKASAEKTLGGGRPGLRP